jgi:hypothetical protein
MSGDIRIVFVVLVTSEAGKAIVHPTLVGSGTAASREQNLGPAGPVLRVDMERR